MKERLIERPFKLVKTKATIIIEGNMIMMVL